MNKATAGLKILLLALVAACSPLRAAQPEATTAPKTGYILVLRVTTNGVVHNIVDSQLVPSPVALSLAPPAADGRSLNYAVVDGKGKLCSRRACPIRGNSARHCRHRASPRRDMKPWCCRRRNT